MPDKGQELFDIMDAALKRQREGRGAARKRPGAATGQAKGAKGKARAARHPAGAAAGPPPPPPVAPVGPVQAVEPVLPVAPATQPPPPADSGRVSTRYTERLSQVPDSARLAPPAGTLSPGEVLRGTVFTSHKPAPPEEAIEPPAPVEGPPRPATVRASASSVIRPPSAAGYTGPTGPVASTIRPSGATPPPISGVQSAVSGPQRSTAAAGQTGARRGIFVSTELAVLAVIGMTQALVCAFFAGMRIGQSELETSGPRKPGSGKRPDGTDGNLKIRDPNGMEHIDVGDMPKPTVGTRKIKPPPAGSGKWTVEVMSYGSEGPAKAMIRRLERDYNVTGARIERRGRNYAVCIGRFQKADAPAAIRLKRDIIAKNPRLFRGPTGIVRLR